MDLYLQMGHGMMSTSIELLKKWGGGTAILSPRNMTHKQMLKFAAEAQALGGNVLIDPQFYLPHSEKIGLTDHTYWPKSYSTEEFPGENMSNMIEILNKDYDSPMKTSAFILPACFSKKIDAQWFEFNDAIISSANSEKIDKPIYATLSLSYEILQSEQQIHSLLEHIETWNVDGYYIMAEYPKSDYFADDPVFLLNLMDLCAGIKLLSKKVIVGYCNHQMLCLGLAKIDAIASGTFMNVRKFQPDIFNIQEKDRGNRSTWYYSPQALSEFQLTFLDMGKRAGILNLVKTDDSFESDYGKILFSGAKPSDTAFSEPFAFKHYLQCLKVQSGQAIKGSYKETLDGFNLQLTTAERLLKELHGKGVRGKHRDFTEFIDINRSALDLFDTLRGFVLSNTWND